eukprot:9453974-Pyramimonas_sp.AAC.1
MVDIIPRRQQNTSDTGRQANVEREYVYTYIYTFYLYDHHPSDKEVFWREGATDDNCSGCDGYDAGDDELTTTHDDA